MNARPIDPRTFTFDQRFDAPSNGRGVTPRGKQFYTPEEVEAVKA